MSRDLDMRTRFQMFVERWLEARAQHSNESCGFWIATEKHGKRDGRAKDLSEGISIIRIIIPKKNEETFKQ